MKRKHNNVAQRMYENIMATGIYIMIAIAVFAFLTHNALFIRALVIGGVAYVITIFVYNHSVKSETGEKNDKDSKRKLSVSEMSM